MWSFGTTMTMANDREHPPQPSSKPIPESRSIAPAPTTSTRPDTRTPFFAPRSLKQLGYFFAGAGFLALSTLVTRRAVVRKIRAGIPRFFEQNNGPPTKLDGDSGRVAVEALGLATVNVVGFGIMFTGGLSWAFDVTNIEELQGMAKPHTGTGDAQLDAEAEEQVAAWAFKILGKTGDLPKELQDDDSTPQKGR